MHSRSFHRGFLALLATGGFLVAGSAVASAQPEARTQSAPSTVSATAVHADAVTAAQQVKDAVETYGNMATGSCLDDSEFGLRGYACNGGVYHKWNVHTWADDTRQFRSVATGDCLYDDGVTLDTRSCNSTPQQSWFVFAHGDKLTFQSQATGECLDDSEFGLRTIPCNGLNNQAWR